MALMALFKKLLIKKIWGGEREEESKRGGRGEDGGGAQTRSKQRITNTLPDNKSYSIYLPLSLHFSQQRCVQTHNKHK